MQIKQYTPQSHKLKAVVYGGSGTGKTTLGGTAPNPIFASSENGLLSIAHLNPAYVEIKTLADIRELLAYLQKGEHNFETVVIDSITEINEIIKSDIARKNGKPMDIKDWGELSKNIRDLLRGFRDLDMHVLFISQEMAVKDGDKIEKYVPNLNGKESEGIAYFMDVVGYIRIDPTTAERTIITSPNSRTLSKDRTNCIGNDTEPNFSTWVELTQNIAIGEEKMLFDSDAPEAPAMVSEEQLAEIEALLAKIKKAQGGKIGEMRSKVCSVVGKEKLEELTSAQAKAIIISLEKKLAPPAEDETKAVAEEVVGVNTLKIREMLPTLTPEQIEKLSGDPLSDKYTEKMATLDLVNLLA